jgi:hypothetical protein
MVSRDQIYKELGDSTTNTNAKDMMDTIRSMYNNQGASRPERGVFGSS